MKQEEKVKEKQKRRKKNNIKKEIKKAIGISSHEWSIKCLERERMMRGKLFYLPSFTILPGEGKVGGGEKEREKRREYRGREEGREGERRGEKGSEGTIYYLPSFLTLLEGGNRKR